MKSRPVVVAARLRPAVASVCMEFRALSMAVMSCGPTECDRSARSNSVMGREADRLGSLSFALFSAVGSCKAARAQVSTYWTLLPPYADIETPALTLRCCWVATSPDACSVYLESWLSVFFLRPKKRLSAFRRVDFLRCGGPVLLRPVLPVEAALTRE